MQLIDKNGFGGYIVYDSPSEKYSLYKGGCGCWFIFFCLLTLPIVIPILMFIWNVISTLFFNSFFLF